MLLKFVKAVILVRFQTQGLPTSIIFCQ